MKKYFKWPVIAAVVSAAIFKDPCIGPFLGLLVGFVIGIPAFYITVSLFNFFVNNKNGIPQICGVCVGVFLVILIHWFLFKPPAWFLFSMKIAYPIPDSVTHLESKSSVAVMDGSHYLWFNINKKDFDKIIQDKSYRLAQELKLRHDNSEFRIELSSSELNFSCSLPRLWFNRIKEMKNPEVYTVERLENDWGSLEYIIYDPNQNNAFYELTSR